MKYYQTIKSFMVGHLNLLLHRSIGKPEPFGVAKNLVQRFKQVAGGIECHAITGKVFAGWNEFQEHLTSSDKCAGLIDLATNEASKVIEGFRSAFSII
jgi:hypothetical protein